MIYIYDILVNLNDSKRLLEFFEWNDMDIIEHIKKIPLIKVDDNTYLDLCNSNIIISKDFLEQIKNRTYTSKEKLNYACCFTNGYRAIVIEFNSKGNILYKSSLLIDEEDEVVSCSSKLNITNINYDVIEKGKITLYKNTRLEDKKISVIKNDLNISYLNKDYDKIEYLYNEIYDDITLNIKEKYNKLNSLLEIDKVNRLYNIINLINKKKNAI